jgi:hypothetical protein
MIAWYRTPSPTEVKAALNSPTILESLKGEFVVETTDGAPVTKQRLLARFAPFALNEDAARLASIGNIPPEEPRSGIYWRSFDFSTGGFVDDDGHEGDWSPDGQALVYEKSGEIRVYEAGSRSSRRLTAGHFPTWRPDGKAIAFEAPDGRASLITPAGTPVNWPFGRQLTAGALRWSPDGRFVSFPAPEQIPLLVTYHRLLVCRVSDRACVGARIFGPGAFNLNAFHWIVNYRGFCKGCAAGQPFN